MGGGDGNFWRTAYFMEGQQCAAGLFDRVCALGEHARKCEGLLAPGSAAPAGRRDTLEAAPSAVCLTMVILYLGPAPTAGQRRSFEVRPERAGEKDKSRGQRVSENLWAEGAHHSLKPCTEPD